MLVGNRYVAKMSATEAVEFPDLDSLINAAENPSGESSGEGNNSDRGAFNPDEYAGFVQWYSEQSKNLQQHYEVHLEHQKQKLAEENEAGFLEDLQQSLKNFEADHMSDFASFSSLDTGCSYLTPSSLSAPDSSNDGMEQQSVLKELLLNPLSENYSREIDPPEQHASSDLNKKQKKMNAEENGAGLSEDQHQSLGNFEADHTSDFASISSLDVGGSYLPPSSLSDPDFSSNDIKQQSMLKELLLSPFSEKYSREIDSPEHALSDLNKFGNSSPEPSPPVAAEKAKSRKEPLKPFTELLKHIEASETTTKKTKPLTNIKSKQSGTRLVNTKRYMSKYATANSNMKVEPVPSKPDSKSLEKRIVVHSVKNGAQSSKTLTLSLKPSSAAKFVSQKPSFTSNSSSVVTATTSLTSPKSAPIFSSSVKTLKTVTITSQKLAEKRAATPPSDQSPQKKPCMSPTNSAGQSADHDYCSTQLSKSEDTTNQSAEAKTSEKVFTPPESPKSQAKSGQKVLKWWDYLQQVRAGVRSAPNSPTTSPKVARGSARPANNFMIVSLQGNQATPKIVDSTMASKGKVNGKMPIPEALRKTVVKQSFGLQEFDKYMKGLKTNINSPPVDLKTDSNVVVTSAANDLPTSKLDSSSNNSFPAAQSLVTMVQQQQHSESLKEKIKASPDKTQRVSRPQSEKDMKKQQKLVPVPTGGSKQQKLLPVSSGSSGQLLMIQVPVSSTSAQRSSSKKIRLTPTTKTPVSTPSSAAVHAASKITPSTHHSLIAVQSNATSNPQPTITTQSNPPRTTSASVPQLPRAAHSSSSDKPAPTFKLMTSNKDGAEAKSLILSGVTGKLKDILTVMAEQQAKCKAENVKPETMSSEQQLNTLQKLISCLSSSQQIPKLNPSVNSNSSKTASKSNVSHNIGRTENASAPTRTTMSQQTTSIEAPQDSEEQCSSLSDNCTVVDGVAPVPESKASEISSKDCLQNSEMTISTAVCEDNVATKSDSKSLACESETAISAVQPTPTGKLESENVTSQLANKSSQIVKSSVQEPSISSSMPNSTLKFSMTRSMAAAEMMASDVIDDGTQEIMVFSKPETKADENNNLATDNDPAVITLEEAMEALEDDEILNQDPQQQTTSLAAADSLFCKLPSYFLTGKLVSEGGKQHENMEGLKMRGMKNVHCDPLISKANEVEFNKLPHYMSSGKYSRPNSPTDKCAVKQAVGENKDFAVKLNRVGDTQHLTQQGTPVNITETYFSKLPSYYTYGRPHPPVKTFNDAVAYAKDDTVTSEMIIADKQEKQQRSSKRKHKRKKKKRKKHKKSSRKEESSEKVLYSKIPSYYLSGRALATHETDRSVRISPLRTFSVRSPSPHSLSYSSRSSISRSRSRSPIHRSRSRRRHSSRSYSRSSSRSLSGSEGESRRSWRREKRSTRSWRGRSYDRRSYDSSDEDRDDYLWRRERDVRRARRQHQDTHEKERQRAMEERRVVYVGGIDKKMTKQELRRKFLRFGNIEAVSLHFRDDGDDYGFLTFQYTSDAFRAIEEGGNLGPSEPRYDLSFGGRRQFCKTAYQDLDSKAAEEDGKANALDDFDALLQQAKRNLRR